MEIVSDQKKTTSTRLNIRQCFFQQQVSASIIQTPVIFKRFYLKKDGTQ